MTGSNTRCTARVITSQMITVARRERGSATVWVLGLIAVLAMSITVAAVQTAAMVAHRRAESAADLVAISAAAKLADLTEAPCTAAAQMALANGVRLAGCLVGSATVTVEVAVTLRLPFVLGGPRLITALSKAGR